MIYATLQNRQEAEFGMITSDNFTSVIFNGKDIVACKRLDEFIKYIDEILINNYEAELAYIDEKIQLLQDIKVSFLNKAVLLYERLKLRAERKRIEELLNDSSEEREVQYLNALRHLGFERYKMYERSDGTMVQEFQTNVDVKALEFGIEELKTALKVASQNKRRIWEAKYNCAMLGTSEISDQSE